jgi:hypothetical protein
MARQICNSLLEIRFDFGQAAGVFFMRPGIACLVAVSKMARRISGIKKAPN